MTLVTTDAEDLTAEIDAIVIPRVTREQCAAAEALVRRRCPADGVKTVLQALGLAPYASNLIGHRPPDRAGMGPRYADCGTVPGAQAHYRRGEELCEVCRAWSADRHAKTRTPPGARCGTATGAQMHRNLGERICEPCRQAEREANRDRHTPTGNPPGRPRSRRQPPPGVTDRAARMREARERAAEDPSLIAHGTQSGYSYWGCRCEDCREAHAISQARWERGFKARQVAPAGEPR